MDETRRTDRMRKQVLPVSVLPYFPAPKWRSLSALIVIILIIMMIWCNSTRIDRIGKLLDRQERIWNDLQISSYEFSLRKGSTEGYYLGEIQVINGEVVAVKTIRGDESYWKPDNSTISKLFDDTLVYANQYQGYSVELEFHEIFGFPVKAVIGTDFTSHYDLIEISDFRILDN